MSDVQSNTGESHKSAIDDESGPGDESGRIGDEIVNGTEQLIGLAEAAKRCLAAHVRRDRPIVEKPIDSRRERA